MDEIIIGRLIDLMEKTKKEFLNSNYFNYVIDKMLKENIKKNYFFEITRYVNDNFIEKFYFNIGSLSCQFAKIKSVNKYTYTFIKKSINLYVFINSHKEISSEEEKNLYELFSRF